VNTQDYSEYAEPSRSWLIALPFAGLVTLGVVWSGFWYYASTTAQSTLAAWQSREADAGRAYGCTKASFSGYPFRIEVDCADPSVDDRKSALSLRAHNLAAVAQVWDPTLLIGQIAGPLTIAPLDGSPVVTADWALAQASLRGLPGAPEQLAITVDKPTLASLPSSGAGPLATAEHMEFHARFAAESAPGHPVIDLALNFNNFTAPLGNALPAPLGALATANTDAAVIGVLRGLPDFGPKPMSQRLRELQAANGRLEITSARLQQGDLIAMLVGAVGLTPRGTLTGDFRVTVINFPKLIPMLGLDRAIAQAIPQDKLDRFAPSLDRLMPGLGNMLRGGNNATPGANASAVALGAAALGGQQTELEGQRAISLQMRIDDGAVFIGPLKIGQIAPLY
jgi:hypothetical protein